MPIVVQGLLSLLEHTCTHPRIGKGVCVAQSLVFRSCFVDHCLSFCVFAFNNCVVCPSICSFWLSLLVSSNFFLSLYIKVVLSFGRNEFKSAYHMISVCIIWGYEYQHSTVLYYQTKKVNLSYLATFI
jgi:hypothetical protein